MHFNTAGRGAGRADLAPATLLQLFAEFVCYACVFGLGFTVYRVY